VQRKVFRVEQMLGERRPVAPERAAGERDAFGRLEPAGELAGQLDATVDEMKREFAAVRELLARNREELEALIGENKTRRMVRAAGELGAAVDGMEQATHKILQAAETIEDSAKSLGSALKTEFERGLAQDIQDHTVQIYEACNFHDLAGQRIAKVIATLHLVDRQLSGMLARCSTLTGSDTAAVTAAPVKNGGLLNGPKLDGDPGHAGQGEIDALFS
jgi:chemotaxis protein CheZ